MRRALAGLTVVAALASLGGCGLADRVVVIREAPIEVTTGGFFPPAAAEAIATRVLGDAAIAMANPDAKAMEVLTGPALRLAEVDRKFALPPADVFEAPSAPVVLAVTAGRNWPRAILATSARAGVQSLHVLVSTSATSPFKLWASVPMEPGAALPALPPLAEGTTMPTDGAGRVASATQIFEAYADQLDVPAITARSGIVGVKDAFATGLDASSAAQVKALGKLGTLSRVNRVTDDVLAFRLADGAVAAFGQMTRTDLLKPTSAAKRLDLPNDLATLSGKKSVTKSLELAWLETMVVVIPKAGAATVIGVEERMRGIVAR